MKMKLKDIDLTSYLMDSLKRQIEWKIDYHKNQQPKDDYTQGWKDGAINNLESVLNAIETYFYKE
jgi:hypothetical protein